MPADSDPVLDRLRALRQVALAEPCVVAKLDDQVGQPVELRPGKEILAAMHGGDDRFAVRRLAARSRRSASSSRTRSYSAPGSTMPSRSRPRTLTTMLPNVLYENARVRDQSTTAGAMRSAIGALAQARQPLLRGTAQAGGQLAPQLESRCQRPLPTSPRSRYASYPSRSSHALRLTTPSSEPPPWSETTRTFPSSPTRRRRSPSAPSRMR